MSLLPYLVAQLPALVFTAAPPLGVEEFGGLARRFLAPRTRTFLDRIRLVPPAAKKSGRKRSRAPRSSRASTSGRRSSATNGRGFAPRSSGGKRRGTSGPARPITPREPRPGRRSPPPRPSRGRSSWSAGAGTGSTRSAPATSSTWRPSSPTASSCASSIGRPPSSRTGAPGRSKASAGPSSPPPRTFMLGEQSHDTRRGTRIRRFGKPGHRPDGSPRFHERGRLHRDRGQAAEERGHPPRGGPGGAPGVRDHQGHQGRRSRGVHERPADRRARPGPPRPDLRRPPESPAPARRAERVFPRAGRHAARPAARKKVGLDAARQARRPGRRGRRPGLRPRGHLHAPRHGPLRRGRNAHREIRAARGRLRASTTRSPSSRTPRAGRAPCPWCSNGRSSAP